MKAPRLKPCRSASRARGIALLAVLVLIALLTLLASTVAGLSVSRRHAAQRFAEAVQADATADSAIRMVLLAVIAPAPGAASAPIQMRQQIETLGVQVDVALEREAGRVDLNFADEKLLTATFMADGWSERSAQTMAARIEDWRDADDTPRLGGAEREEYQAAGLPYGPRNGPLESSDELRQVLGGRDVSTRLLDCFTVYTHRETPIFEAANAALQHVLSVLPDPMVGESSPPSLIGEVIRVRACLKLGAYERCRIMVARLTGSRQRPLQIFEWRTREAPP